MGLLLHAELTIMFLAMQKNSRNEAIAVQARAKALREQQRTRLDARHKYVLGLVANRLDLEESVVEDFMLDGDQVGVTLAHCCLLLLLLLLLFVCFTTLQGSQTIFLCSLTCLIPSLRPVAEKHCSFTTSRQIHLCLVRLFLSSILTILISFQ